MNEKTVNITDFIGVYDNYITEKECDNAIKLYENFNNEFLELKVITDSDIKLFRGKLEDNKAIKIRSESKKTSLLESLNKIEIKGKELKSGIECPTCGKPSTKEDIEKVRQEYINQWKDIKNSIKEEDNILDDVNNKISKETKELELLESEYSVYNTKKNTLNQYLIDRDRLSKELEDINSSIDERNKLIEIKYKKEAGERKQKVVEWLRKDNAIEMENYKRQIEDLKQKLAEKEVMVMNIEERLEKDDDELIGEMDFEEIYKTINKKTTKKTTKTDGKKTCVSKGDIRISSKVLRDKEKITMSGKWTTEGMYQAEYDKGDDLFYELDGNEERIQLNNFENINKYGNHIYKNHQPQYEGKKNMWAVMKVYRWGKWCSMLDLPIIEE